MASNIINDGFAREYMALYRALSDSEFRESIKSRPGLDPGLRDLLRMMDDPVYIKMLGDASIGAKSTCIGVAAFKDMADNIKKLQEYACNRYSEGWALIEEYGRTANNPMVRNGGTIIVNTGGTIVVNTGGTTILDSTITLQGYPTLYFVIL